MSDQPGQKIGKYEIIEELGRGGFAVVYKAHDPDLDRAVALKVLAPHLTWDPTFAGRFRREAQSTANLRHPNIVTVHEVGQADGHLYIAMEYLPGRTLAELLKAEGAMPLERALPILEQVADAMDYAHGQGVIHRDVKPSNVMVEPVEDGKLRATLMDFGLVKALESSESLTSAGTVQGSPEYMAPEQADLDRKGEVGPAADRYALGVVAYEMLTGRAPFEAEAPLAVLHAHVYQTPPNPRTIHEGLSTTVSQALLKALSKAPDERYPTARAMVEALLSPYTYVPWPGWFLLGFILTGIAVILFRRSFHCWVEYRVGEAIVALIVLLVSSVAFALAEIFSSGIRKILRLVISGIALALLISLAVVLLFLPSPAEETCFPPVTDTPRAVGGGAPTSTGLVAVTPANTPTHTSSATYTLRPTGTPPPVATDTVVPTSLARPSSTPTRADTYTAVPPSPTVSTIVGKLSFQVPEGVSLASSTVYDQATGNALGSVNGTGPFLLPPGTYRVTLRDPFVGVSLGDVTVESGKETLVDVSQGLGTLSLQVPESVSVGSSTVYDQATGNALGSANGSGPFWLPPGTYRVTLRDPFVGVSLGDVMVESGEGASVDVSQGLGTLSLQVPEGVSLGSSTIYDQATGKALGSVNGSGPFWLPPGTYGITLRSPFVGVNPEDVTVQSGREASVNVSQGLGTLSLQVPEGVSLGSSTVTDQATGNALGSVNGTGPFLLPPGTYRVTLRDPFVGVSLSDVTVESGEVTSVDVTQGLGTLSLQVPEGVSLGSSTVYDQATGNALGSVNGSGPFWLPPGTYRVTLRAPFVGVSLDDVTVQSGRETEVEVR